VLLERILANVVSLGILLILEDIWEFSSFGCEHIVVRNFLEKFDFIVSFDDVFSLLQADSIACQEVVVASSGGGSDSCDPVCLDLAFFWCFLI